MDAILLTSPATAIPDGRLCNLALRLPSACAQGCGPLPCFSSKGCSPSLAGEDFMSSVQINVNLKVAGWEEYKFGVRSLRFQSSPSQRLLCSLGMPYCLCLPQFPHLLDESKKCPS